MDESGKTGGVRVAAWLIISLLGMMVTFSTAANAQETQHNVLTMGKPEEVGMSGPVIRAAVSLYSEAVARGDILGAVLLVARRGKVVLYEAVGVRDREKNLPMEKGTLFQIM